MRRIVVSYAREDLPVVQELIGILTGYGHHVWSDANTRKGSRWWDGICEQVRGCDLLVAVVSPAMLSSKACRAEREYAMQLGKPLLPVVVSPVNVGSLPREVAQIDLFDFTRRDATAGARLFTAVSQMPPAPPLPQRLPTPPAPPLSYLNDIADQMHWLPADPRRQHQIVIDLEGGLRSGDQEERATAHELLVQFAQHPARLADPAARAQQALAVLGDPVRPGPAQAGPPGGQAPAAPARRRNPAVTVLAWVGGGVLALLALVTCSVLLSDDDGGRSDPQLPTSFAAQQVEAAVTDAYLNNGIVLSSATCGTLAAQVGSTTTCTVTAGSQSVSASVQLTAVQGGRPIVTVTEL